MSSVNPDILVVQEMLSQDGPPSLNTAADKC
jgi:hypothetical protein